MTRTEDRQEVAAFVRELFLRSGCTTWKEFADRAGVLRVQVSNWQRGLGAPDARNLLRLIHASGGIPDGAEAGVDSVSRYERDVQHIADCMAAIAEAAAQIAVKLTDSCAPGQELAAVASGISQAL